jgi:hypothetical protein
MLISIDGTEQRRCDRGFYQQTFQSIIVVGLLTNFVACQGFGVPAYRPTMPMCIPIGTHRFWRYGDVINRSPTET